MEEPFRILIVDDEAGIRHILKMFLDMEGYQVDEAISAQQAKEKVETHRPHIIILDVVLCGQNGFEFCEWIKENPETKDIIVILFTALNQEYDYSEGSRVKCDYYMTKPQNPKDIIKKVKEYIDTIKNDKS